jgi:hypothetical protein
MPYYQQSLNKQAFREVNGKSATVLGATGQLG